MYFEGTKNSMKWSKIISSSNDYFDIVKFSPDGKFIATYMYMNDVLYVFNSLNGSILNAVNYGGNADYRIFIDSNYNIIFPSYPGAYKIIRFNALSSTNTLWTLYGGYIYKCYGLVFGENEDAIYLTSIARNYTT
jgi:hypothetical protein